MKFSLHSHLSDRFLALADEIRIAPYRLDRAEDLFEKYPEKRFTIEIHPTEDLIISMAETVKKISALTRNTFSFANVSWACPSLNEAIVEDLRDHGFTSYYLDMPILTHYELNAVRNLGVSCVRLGPPLFFDLDSIKMPIRLEPNVAYYPYLPHTTQEAICGQWIRPEDIPLYEPYAFICQFYEPTRDAKKEEALFHIYAENKTWPGSLNHVVAGLESVDVPNVFDDLAKYRLNCRQRCQTPTGSCHLCPTAFNFSQTMLRNRGFLKEAVRKKKEGN